MSRLENKSDDQILQSERDKQVFFDAIISDTLTNEALKKAAEKYSPDFKEEED